ncbi:hypothetical protein DFJ58DRAFT_845762 [Suillus subalutaceus]|uniref:uncharacterized protein n=1 Tax=Suillus subalutaceus TaxID=48586 RepID=UPI001B885F7F|nr:uncharacterized protein DFJ58DRAFT_845762 [Suillus subalutaceus]KAG1839201.1 hypothetical protein DFJ58DRAFT_845762 [Suillus subalutaceus]
MYEEIKKANPEWLLNPKTEATNKACIAVKLSDTTTISTSITQGLLLLLANLNPINETRPISDLEALHVIEHHLPQGEAQPPLVLFPRRQDINDWYFHVHHTSRCNDDCRFHPVMLEIFGKQRCPHGDILVVKDGTGYIPDSPEFDVDCEELGRTLWWYIRSGINPVQEASERRLINVQGMRDIDTMYDRISQMLATNPGANKAKNNDITMTGK